MLGQTRQRKPGFRRSRWRAWMNAIAIASGIGIGQLGFAYFGGDHACAVLSDGSARCWGLGGAGQLGEGRLDVGMHSLRSSA
jgi:Regulator of Chromosome Condensation (RCC1) repeat protein